MSLIKIRPYLNLCLNHVINRTNSSHSISRAAIKTSSNLVNSFLLTSSSKVQNEYKCPSQITFKIPLNDIKINDVLIKQEFKLPQLRNQIELIDPLLHIEKALPQSESVNSNVRYECNKPLNNVLRYRRRHMNRKKQAKFYKKRKYILLEHKILKEKRYDKLLDMYRKIFEEKTDRFDPTKLIYREIEKAKFYGYKVNDVYDKYRFFIKSNVKKIDEKYFRKFDDIDYANFATNKRSNCGKRMPLGFDYTRDGKLEINQTRKGPRGFDAIRVALKKLENND